MPTNTLTDGSSFGPYNYSTVAVDPAAAIQSGMKTANAINTNQESLAHLDRQDALRQKLGELLTKETVSSEDMAPILALSDPEQINNIKAAFELKTVEQQQESLQVASSVWAAINNGKPETAVRLLREKAKMYEEAGDVAHAHAFNLNADMIEADPAHSKATAAMWLSTVKGGNTILDAYIKAKSDQQNDEERPYRLDEIKSKADKARIDAESEQEFRDSIIAKNMSKQSASASPDGVDYIAKVASITGHDLVAERYLFTKSQMEQFQRNMAQKVKDGFVIDENSIQPILDGLRDKSQAVATGRAGGSAKVLGQRENIDAAMKLLDDMKETNKKLNLSRLKYKGKAENWIKDATNDPEFIRYRTQRADNLFQLTNALKQNGITDKSIEIEEQAAALTMDEKAFEAWYDTQKTALKRIKEQKDISYGERKDLSKKSSKNNVLSSKSYGSFAGE